MELPGSKRIGRVFDQFRKLTLEKQGVYSIVLAKRLLSVSEEAFINRSALDLKKIDILIQTFYAQILSEKRSIGILKNSLEESKSIYTFKRDELMSSQAIDAISMIETSFLILVEAHSDFTECVNSYIDSIDLIVQDLIDDNSTTEDRELLIYKHEVMQSELKFLEDFIKFIKQVKKVDVLAIEKIEDIFIFEPGKFNAPL